MPYISTNYDQNPDAKVGTWVCDPNSGLGPYEKDSPPPKEPTNTTKHPSYCGQCVSYVKQVMGTLPSTDAWQRGTKVKDTDGVLPGTVIATFNEQQKYSGHAAIFVAKTGEGLEVYDQWISGTGSPIGKRVLRYTAKGNSNCGENFYIVEPPGGGTFKAS